MRDPIIIVGSPRSGTSIVARIFAACGASGGFITVRKSDRHRFENPIITRIIEHFLADRRYDPRGQCPLPPAAIMDRQKVQALKAQIFQTFLRQGVNSDRPFLKSDVACLLWPTIMKAFPDADWVVVRRDAHDTVNSCLKTGYMNAYSSAVGWYSWQQYYTALLSEIELNVKKSVAVWPSKFLSGEFDEMRAAIESCGLRWNDDEAMELVLECTHG